MSKTSPSDVRHLVILLYTPVALTLLQYYGLAGGYVRSYVGNGPGPQYFYFLSSLVLLGVIPFLIWTLVFRLSVAELGIRLGDVKKGLLVVAIGLPLMAVLAYLSSKSIAFQREYPLLQGLMVDRSGVFAYFLIYGLYYIGWEVYFRGFMLFGLRDGFGDTASILIQTIPSCLLHVGKPAPEAFGSIVAGIVFGWIVFKTRSIWPVLILHWALGVMLDIFLIYG